MGEKKKNMEDMTIEELRKELEFVRGCLLDEEEMHAFSMHRTSVHIGAQEAKRMQNEHEEQCSEYRERIKKLQEALDQKTPS